MVRTLRSTIFKSTNVRMSRTDASGVLELFNTGADSTPGIGSTF